MKKSTIIAGVILAVAILAAYAMITFRPAPPRRAPVVQAPLVQTVRAQAESGALNVAGNGTVRPRARVNLAPQVSGKVVYVSPAMVSGARVRKGQVLARIEQADYQNRLKQAAADVAQQEVGLLQAEEEAQIARAEYERFKKREDTRQKISPYASVDGNDYASRLLADAGSSTEEGSASSTDDPSQLVLREPQRLAAEAALARAEAVLEDARLALSRTSIVAPFDGYIQSESIDEGQFVSMGQAVGEIYAADEIEVIVPLSTDEAALIPNLWSKRPDKNDAEIAAGVFMDYGGHSYRWDGYVHRAEAALDPATRTVDVVLRVPAPHSGGELVSVPGEVNLVASQAPPLLVGQYTSVEIAGAELDNYFVIPRRALRVNDEIWTIKDDSLVHITRVQVIQKVDENVFIVGDLNGDTDVIVSDLPAVTEGMRVRASK